MIRRNRKVTPTGRHPRGGFEESSWKATEENLDIPNKEEFNRNTEERKSKTKRVRNYLKKCKNALSGKQNPQDQTPNNEQTCSYWYVDNDNTNVKLNDSEETELNESMDLNCEEQIIQFEKVGPNYNSHLTEDNDDNSNDSNDELDETTDQNESFLPEDLLKSLTESFKNDENKEKLSDAEVLFGNEGKCDVGRLIDSLMGPLYHNYSRTRPVLVRQARDLLVCEYFGNFQRFENEFCIPAARLLQQILEDIHKENDASVKVGTGWPLSIGKSGVILHLGAIDPSLLRNRDCYLCVRGRSAPGLEVALVWRRGGTISCRTLAQFNNPIDPNDNKLKTSTKLTTMADMEISTFEDLEGEDLPELLQNLLVSVEHAIDRVPLDDLAFPCYQCQQYLPLNSDNNSGVSCSCHCSCSLPDTVITKKDTSIQTSPMFEFAGAIPHIDSDEDDFEKDSCKGLLGPNRRIEEIMAPKNIMDIPEKLLMSGINLPGTHDTSERPVVLCDAPCVARAGLNQYEVATLLLYYATIPSKQRTERGFTILVLAETAEESTLDILDKAIVLISVHVKISNVILWRPGRTSQKWFFLNNSKIKVHPVIDEAGLLPYLTKNQSPASCGGTATHDQLEWVEFFKELEPFLEQCHSVCRNLLAHLQNIRDEDVPHPVVRRFLHHQQRQLNRALQDPNLQNFRRTSSITLGNLTERAQWLTSSEDVRRRSMYAKHTHTTADRIVRRLEELEQMRKTRLEELNRLRALEDEANKILAWLRKEGDEAINYHSILQRTLTSPTEIKQQEQDFEKFYFGAMRQIDKVGDLLDASLNCQSTRAANLRETASILRAEMRTFHDRLEELRERLEDTSRCFDILARCRQGQQDNGEILAELSRLANKSGNEKLVEKCQELSSNHLSQLTPQTSIPSPEIVTSTPVKLINGPHRRRSVSSFAFIYKCNHHAAGVSCDCWETEDSNTESAKLKKKYVQSLQNCPCNGTDRQTNLSIGLWESDDNSETKSKKKLCCKLSLDRQNSLGLDNIKEVRESIEDLIEPSEKNDSGVSGCGRCDSGISTGHGSCQAASDDGGLYKKRLGSCSCCGDNGPGCSESSSSGASRVDHTDHQQDSLIEESDSFPKSNGSDELEEHDEQYNNERNKTIPPIPVNSHLHCHAFSLDLPNIQDHNLDPKTQKTLLLIMREMIQTERDYAKSLYYVIENYIPELLREDIPQALRGQRNVVFGNIEKIYEFHSQQFLRELEMCENSPLQVGQTFLRHTNRFSLYALYNKNKPKSDSLMTEYGRSFFKSKQVELNDNLDLASYLLKPVQRMGKYALLLQQLMKALPALPEGASERLLAEREDLIAAEDMVKFQLRHGNDLLAMDSIRDCDVNLKEQGRLLRQNEFLVSEGRGAKKSLRQVFLFEELILFSKARRFPDRKNLDLYIYKNSIKMTDIGLTAKIGDSPTKFEIWFRKRKPNDTFVLQSMSEEVKRAWTEELSKLLWRQAMKNREIRLQEMSSMGIGNKPCLDIRPSADQINDRSISIAQLSKTAPRFRNSIVGPVTTELCNRSNRPQSIISVSSISSSSTSSQGSNGTLNHHITAPIHGFESADSPLTHHKSRTLNSQCSTESGIIADISLGSDDCPELQNWTSHKSNTLNSNTSSIKSTATNSVQTDETTQVSLFHVPDDIPVNI